MAAGGITITAILATFNDLFPLPNGWTWLMAVAVVLFACAAIGSVPLTKRFFSARRRIVMETSILSPFRQHDPRNRFVAKDEKDFLIKPLEAFAWEREPQTLGRLPCVAID